MDFGMTLAIHQSSAGIGKDKRRYDEPEDLKIRLTTRSDGGNQGPATQKVWEGWRGFWAQFQGLLASSSKNAGARDLRVC